MRWAGCGRGRSQHRRRHRRTGHGAGERGGGRAGVDTAHGHSHNVLERVRWIKERFPNVQVIGGNIATAAAARDLVEAGVDAVKVGIGPGSICTTRIIAGVGVPQISAVANVADALRDSDVPLIADGGVAIPAIWPRPSPPARIPS